MKSAALIFSVLMALSGAARAWREGNGGDGVKAADTIQLLDLVEAGVEGDGERPVEIENVFIRDEVHRFAAGFSHPLPEVWLQSKLQQIDQKNQVLALTLLLTLQKLNWHWVNYPLQDLKDEGDKLQIPRELLVQMALRINQTVQVDLQNWKKMSPRHQAALLLHEALYALMIPDRDENGIDRNSPKVRNLIGFIFSPDFAQKAMTPLLETEAPHLIFPTALEMDLEPVWSRDHKEIHLHRKWFRSLSWNGSEQMESLAVGSSQMADWTERLCQLSTSAQSSFLLGLQADTLALNPMEIEQEEFYLAPAFAWQMPLRSRSLEPSKSVSECAENVQRTQSDLLSQTSRSRTVDRFCPHFEGKKGPRGLLLNLSSRGCFDRHSGAH